MMPSIVLLVTGLLLAAGPFDIDESPPATMPATQPSPATQPATRPADIDSPSVPRTIADVIAKDIRPSVCRIVVMGANGQPKAFGSGFVVSDDGYIITNNHVVEGATAAEVEFPDEDSHLTGELWQTWPQYDLALIKISGRACRPLTISKSDPQQAEDVFTLGFPLSKEASLKVTRGIVSSMVDWKEFCALIGVPLTEYAQDIRFVQIDSAINSGNSGGPLINSRGEVIGVNSLVYLKGDSMFYAVSAEHVAKLVATKASKASGFKVKAAPAEATELVKRPTKPKEDVKFPADVTPEQLAQSGTKNRPPHTVAGMMLDLINVRRTVCDKCAGKGEITYQVQTGMSGTGGIAYPVFETRTKPCAACKHTGKTTPKPVAVQQALQRALAALAELDPTLTFADPKMADVARRWEAVVFENVINFGETQQWSADKLKTATKGATVMSVGVVLDKKELAGHDAYLVYTGTPGTYLLTGQMHETRVTGDAVVVAGVIGDTISLNGKRFIVVNGGLVIDAPAKTQHGK